MNKATDNPKEYKQCLSSFEKWEREYHPTSNLRKRRKKVNPGEGRYFDDTVQMRWLTWRACWYWLRTF